MARGHVSQISKLYCRGYCKRWWRWWRWVRGAAENKQEDVAATFGRGRATVVAVAVVAVDVDVDIDVDVAVDIHTQSHVIAATVNAQLPTNWGTGDPRNLAWRSRPINLSETNPKIHIFLLRCDNIK